MLLPDDHDITISLSTTFKISEINDSFSSLLNMKPESFCASYLSSQRISMSFNLLVETYQVHLWPFHAFVDEKSKTG